jgi:uncharacterized protein with von Willebrand factor type A (vWA) domain
VPDAEAGAFIRNWLRFGVILNGLGLEAGPARMLPFIQSLSLIDLQNRADVRAAVRAHFARRREDMEQLERALNAFLRSFDPVEPQTSASERRVLRRATHQLSVLSDNGESEPEDESERTGYSIQEMLRDKDFASLTEEEMRDVRRVIANLRVPAGQRRTRRFRRGGRERIDLRRLLRSSLRMAGEPLELSFRQRRLKPRPLVLLCDISGSMERYSRLLLNFAYALEKAEARVEAFVFATRLTRITRQLRSRTADSALDRISRGVEDWSGGTRIGEAVGAFNHRYARRVLGHGATVVLISDGWDRGDPQQLAAAMARLQRAAHRVIWMNPLIGAPGYEPLTRGMQAALPFIDDFLPAQNLRNLEQLGELLLEVGDERPVRRPPALTA